MFPSTTPGDRDQRQVYITARHGVSMLPIFSAWALDPRSDRDSNMQPNEVRIQWVRWLSGETNHNV